MVYLPMSYLYGRRAKCPTNPLIEVCLHTLSSHLCIHTTSIHTTRIHTLCIHPPRIHTPPVFTPHSYSQALRSELYVEPYDKINWAAQRNNCGPADMYTPHHWMQARVLPFLILII